MIIYFSGTGNSRHCALRAAELLGDEAVDVFLYLREKRTESFSSRFPYVFVAPTYAWQLPHIFTDFLTSCSFKGDRRAYFIMTCGDDTGNAAAKNEGLCRQLGLTCMGTAAVVMPENYIAMFDSPDLSTQQKILRRAQGSLERLTEKIRRQEPFDKKSPTVTDRLKSGPVNSLFYALLVSPRGFRVKENCTGCGKCAGLCPLGAISLQQGRPTWGKDCTHCMACINHCPVEAIEYGRKSVGKLRYTYEQK